MAKKDTARAALEKPAKAIAATETGVRVQFEDGTAQEYSSSSTTDAPIGAEAALEGAGGTGVNPTDPAGASHDPAPYANVAREAAEKVASALEAAAEATPPRDRALDAALTFQVSMMGFTPLTPDERQAYDPTLQIMVDFVRTYPDAPAEAAYMHTRARIDEPSIWLPWSDMVPEARLSIRSFVKALRLADRLVAELEAAERAEAEAERQAEAAKVKVPVDETIFEGVGAETGFDPDYARDPEAAAQERQALEEHRATEGLSIDETQAA